jgi:23S rRNA (adenine1618-N6)-methyltransferase
MAPEKKKSPATESKMHPKNKHREKYDFNELIAAIPELEKFVRPNEYGDKSIDFSNGEAVKLLNKAILSSSYEIKNWDIPQGYLCPPIPGRADYIHHVAELMGKLNYGKIPYTYKTKCLDIGVGASCVYPLIGNKEYGWSFIGSDIDPLSVESSKKIIDGNEHLKRNIDIRLQKNSSAFFKGVLKDGERVNLSICNPPFHRSLEEAQRGSLRKTKNLKGKQHKKPILNFGGHSNELWCEGGEKRFVRDMIFESKDYGDQVYLFSTIISKQANLKSIYQALHAVDAAEIITVPMGQGNKVSRIVAWSFLTKEQRRKWKRGK